MKQIYHSTSKIDGMGIFAGEDIKKGETISCIKGAIKFKINRNKKDALAHPNWVGIKENHWIDPEKPYKFLNHSCEPSCGMKGQVTLVANRDMKEGDEITIDYSIIEGDSRWEMRCNCGEKNCRETIGSVQFLPNEQFLKYLPYIPPYFKNLYLKNHNRRLKHA